MKKSYLAAPLGALALLAATPAAAQHGTTSARVQAFRANLTPVPHDPVADAPARTSLAGRRSCARATRCAPSCRHAG